MINNCIVLSKQYKKLVNKSDLSNILFYEDNLSIASISEARKLTDKIFSTNKDFINKYDFEGYKVSWSWYSDIFQFCINYLELVELIQKIELLDVEHISIGKIPAKYSKVIEIYFFDKKISIQNSKTQLWHSLKELGINLTMLLYSIISLIFLAIMNKERVGTYTGDFIYKNTKSDFRLNHLYDKYNEKNINYVEFIRETTIKNFFVNMVKRRRFSIYYTSLIYLAKLLTKKSKYIDKPKDFFQSIIFKSHYDNLVLLRSIPFVIFFLRKLKINNFVLFSFSSRSASLAVASKSININTIGIMHGLSQKDYVVHEFIESYNESKKIGCDIFGVWSPYYINYYRKYCKITSPSNISYSGLLRPIKKFDKPNKFKRISNNKIKILLISEPLVKAKEIFPYLKSLSRHDDINIAIKVRPMIKDVFYEELIKIDPQIKNLDLYDGKIEEDSEGFDVLLGSMSTAIVEGSLLGKISVLINTEKFGDYYEMDSLILNQSLLVKDPELLYNHILFRLENEHILDTINIIRKKFFGDNKDGANWIVEQIK